jgi:outer membrane protein OmpU
MKKVLFATTALVATAGVASAEVAVTGWAEMGIFGGTGMETQFFTDIDVLFRMSGETDNGLTFGAGVDLDENGAFSVNDDGGAFMFVSGNFGTLTMGDTDGALDWAMTEAWVGNAGSIADDETAHAGALGSYLDGAYDGQILRYDNTFGDVGVAVSVEIDDTGARDNGFAVGFRYGMDLGGADVNFGLGYQNATYAAGVGGAMTVAGVDVALAILAIPAIMPVGYQVEVDAIGVSAAVSTDAGLSAAVAFTQFDASYLDGSAEATHVGVGIGYTMDALTLSANWGAFDGDGTVVGLPFVIDQTGFGIAAAYDLGGGASILAGYGSSEVLSMPSTSSFSLGIAMSF